MPLQENVSLIIYLDITIPIYCFLVYNMNNYRENNPVNNINYLFSRMLIYIHNLHIYMTISTMVRLLGTIKRGIPSLYLHLFV